MMEALEDSSTNDHADHHPVKRRRGGDWGRDWICDFENCTKDFKSVSRNSQALEVIDSNENAEESPHSA